MEWDFLAIKQSSRRIIPLYQTEGQKNTIPLKESFLTAIESLMNWGMVKNCSAFCVHMMIWGGENVEMAIRVWVCGGSMLTLPCSHIGHIFRMYSPYTSMFDREDHATKNTNRLVEVWMDQYKPFYYYLKHYTLNGRCLSNTVTCS